MKNQDSIPSLILSPLTIISSRVITTAALFLALSGLATAANDNEACRNATLKGDYAFTIRMPCPC